MIKSKLSFVAFLAALAMCCLPDKTLFAQSTDPLVLIISYGEGREDSRVPSKDGVVAPVVMRRDQMMPFALEFPSDKVGQTVQIGSLDGGQVTRMDSVTNLTVTADRTATFSFQPASSLLVPSDSKVHFGFQPGASLGLYRLLVQLPGEEHLLQLYVVNTCLPPP